MKKTLFYIFLIAFFIPKISFGSWNESTDLDLYKKIDKGYYDIELKYLDQELRGGFIDKKIVDDLNNRALANKLKPCFIPETSVSDVRKVYLDIDSVKIVHNLIKSCYDDKESISQDIFNKYVSIIKESYMQNFPKAKEMTENLYKIGRIGMYSDGVDENSPYDIISDLNEIDSIIFEEDLDYDYGYRDADIHSTGPGLLTGPYNRENDNKLFPCNNFFCIVIDFSIYDHKLLSWGLDLPIEAIIKRSNEHLKKFASTSLIQAKMTTNNYEIGLRDLNLPDIFHVGVQVSYKPVPLLNVEKDDDGKKADDEFKYGELFKKYFTNIGLDYDRENDLHLFTKQEQDRKGIYDSSEKSYTYFGEKLNDYTDYIDELQNKNRYITDNVVNKKVLDESIKGFYLKFTELESFSRAFMDYTLQVKGIINKMNKIPQGGS